MSLNELTRELQEAIKVLRLVPPGQYLAGKNPQGLAAESEPSEIRRLATSEIGKEDVVRSCLLSSVFGAQHRGMLPRSRTNWRHK